jgi:CRISPR-associated protein Csm5
MLDAKNIVLTTLSPIHIEGREVEYGWGMVKLDFRDAYAYVIDQDKLAAFLAEEGLVDKYVERFSTPDSFKGQGVRDFLNDCKLLKQDILVKISSGQTLSRPRGHFVRDGKDRVIIPGSSIKGALRTSVAYRVLRDQKQNQPDLFTKDVVNTVMKKLDEYQNIRDSRIRADFRKTFFSELMKRIFGPEPHYDLFKCVKVSDAVQLNEQPQMETIKVVCISGAHNAYFSQDRRKGTSDIELRSECLPEGTRAAFNITLDQKSLQQWIEDRHTAAPFKTIEDLLQIAHDYASAQWSFEKGFLSSVASGINFVPLKRFYQGQGEPSLRLGWGTGMMGTTIDLLFDDPLRKRIRDISTPRNDPAPKSRRVVMRNGTPSLPLGWVKLTSS